MKLKYLILEKISELGEAAMSSFFPEKYPEARAWRSLLSVGFDYKFSRQNFSVILSKLKKEGFVERMNSRQNSVWRLTKKGKIAIKEQEASSLLSQRNDGIMRIVSFDIPERERKKRRWIREELLGLGYAQLQKSVWVGFASLSEDFFEDLDLLSLREHIHIFSVDKRGTIAQTK